MPFVAALCGFLLSCAQEQPRASTRLRNARSGDIVLVDSEGSDAQPPEDVATFIDAAAPPAPLPADARSRAIYVRVRPDRPEDGLRAALLPAQGPPLSPPDDVLAALPEPMLVYDFDGPSGENTGRLLDRLASGQAASPLFIVSDRPTELDADVAFLVAQILQHPSVIEPTIFLSKVALPPERLADVSRVVEFIVRTSPETRIGLEVDLSIPFDDGTLNAIPPGVRFVFPLQGAGFAIDGSRPQGDAEDLRSTERWRRSVRERFDFVPMVRPPRNPRLDDPGGVVEAPTAAAFLRALVLARRSAVKGLDEQRGAVLVDGLSAWRDDRQLDPIDETVAPTTLPQELTLGARYVPYGRRRVEVLAETFGPAALSPPSNLETTAPLLPLVSTAGLSLRGLEVQDGWVSLVVCDVGGGTSRLEVLLHAGRFVLPNQARLEYARTLPELHIELVFSGEDSLHARTPLPPTDALDLVSVSLSPFAGRVVEEILLVYSGAGGCETRGLVRLPTFEGAR